MSTSHLSDLQLDRLLGQVAPPAPPKGDLADRIVARSLRTPQARRLLFPTHRRHAARRRPVTWSVVIAANLMAAAAAAAAWDGQQFDFHRLTDVPHRVMLAIREGRHHHETREQMATKGKRSELRIASREQPPVVVPDHPPISQGLPSPGIKTALPPAGSRGAVVAGAVEKPRMVHAHAALERRPSSVRSLAAIGAKPHKRAIAAAPAAEPVGHAVAARRERTEEGRPDQMPREYHSELARTLPPREPSRDQASTPERSAEETVQPSTMVQGQDIPQSKIDRVRGRRWPPFFRRAHPREHGNRFRRRF
jgi:hypothetical protein